MVAQLVADYEAGIPTTTLTKRYSLGKGTVLKLLKAHGVVMRRQGFPADQLAEAIQHYAEGWSAKRIGEHLVCDAETVRQALKRAGVAMRSPHER